MDSSLDDVVPAVQTDDGRSGARRDARRIHKGTLLLHPTSHTFHTSSFHRTFHFTFSWIWIVYFGCSILPLTLTRLGLVKVSTILSHSRRHVHIYACMLFTFLIFQALKSSETLHLPTHCWLEFSRGRGSGRVAEILCFEISFLSVWLEWIILQFPSGI